MAETPALASPRARPVGHPYVVSPGGRIGSGMMFALLVWSAYGTPTPPPPSPSPLFVGVLWLNRKAADAIDAEIQKLDAGP